MGAIDELRRVLGEIYDLGRARALAAWDERTQMPPRGATARAEQLATLARLRHERLSSDELGRLLEAARAELGEDDPTTFEASLIRVTAREWEKARRVPAQLRGELARASSIAETAWEAARAASEFAAFLPHLERIVELKRRYAECFDVDHPYDALLDDFEPGMRTAEVIPVLDRVRDGTVPLLAAIAARGDLVDDSCLYGEFPVDRQAELARRVLTLLPLEDGAWRLDETTHPFATGIAISDLRITTRFDPGYLGAALWAVIHEAGHAMYQNGIDPAFERTPLCRSASLGFDESQSRLWENWVGRGRPLLHHLHPVVAEAFPEQLAGVDAEALYRAANRVRPSLIRMEADEVTYNLHIVLRFELELAIFEDRLKLAELPEAWRARTRDLLGIEVPDDARGVLQDIHWAAGSFGYFPTYSLGNVIAAQLWELARDELPALDDQLAAGELEPLREFLRQRLHRRGGTLEPAELIVEVTGGQLDTEPLLRHLWAKFGELYEVAPPGSKAPAHESR